MLRESNGHFILHVTKISNSLRKGVFPYPLLQNLAVEEHSYPFLVATKIRFNIVFAPLSMVLTNYFFFQSNEIMLSI